MELNFLSYFIFAASFLVEGYYAQTAHFPGEFDRARSAWNFGGQQIKSRQWVRPKNVPGPGAVIANRRVGDSMRTNAWAMPSSATLKKQYPNAPTIRSRQSNKPYQKPNRPKSKPMKLTKFNRNSSVAPAVSSFQRYPMSPLPRPSMSENKKTGLPKTMSSMRHRVSRMMDSRSDNILNKFRKEDLWHLDKGESYELKNEDLYLDNILRNPHEFEMSNEIYDEPELEKEKYVQFELDEFKQTHEVNQPEHDTKHNLEVEAEKLVNEAEKAQDTPNLNHVHHHHHYQGHENKSKTHHPTANKLIPAPLPRIHLPLPLGCLLAVPAFHPIRPRHHLTCLLSIPGTPNMMKRRRKRSTDQPTSAAPSASTFFQLVDLNQRMSPVISNGMRKHFGGHVGNGKGPAQPMNLKVPATIIAPPQFDKADVLEMLLGSGGVNPKEMGTVLATNSRYVRFGRGLPNRGGMRTGRVLPWFTDSLVNNIRNSNKYKPPSAPPQTPSVASSKSQQPQNNNPPPPVNQTPPKPPVPAPTPTITFHQTSPLSPTPTISVTPQVKPTANLNSSPLILNVQITPSHASSPSGPIITVSTSQQQQPPPTQQQQQPPLQPQPQQTYSFQSMSMPSGKSKKKEYLKTSQYWSPVSEEKAKPQKTYNHEFLQSNDVLDTTDTKTYNYQQQLKTPSYDQMETSDSKSNYQNMKPITFDAKEPSDLKAYYYKPKSQSYDQMETSDSNVYYQKVKPSSPYDPMETSETKLYYQKSPSTSGYVKKNKNKSKYSTKYYDSMESIQGKENSNVYSFPSKSTSQGYYETGNQASFPDNQDLSSVLNYFNGKTNDEYKETTYDLPVTQNWNDNIATTPSYDTQTQYQPESYSMYKYSYAVKKEPEEQKTFNNAFYFDSGTVGTFPDTDFDVEDGANSKAKSSIKAHSYSGYDSQEGIETEESRNPKGAYYMVKKLQASDPILINVPKDSFSNEIM